MKNKKELFILLFVVLDFILLALMIFFGIRLLRDIVGYDFIIYEDYYGLMDDPSVYRFGAGCWECTLTIVKFILFTGIQIFLTVKEKFRIPLLIVGLLFHLIILAAGLFLLPRRSCFRCFSVSSYRFVIVPVSS